MNTDDMEPKGDAAAANKELDGWKINNFKTNTTLGNFYNTPTSRSTVPTP